MKTLEFKFGSTKETLSLPNSVNELKIKEPKKNIDKTSFQQALKSRIESSGKDFSNVGIVIGDKTRLCDYPLYLPWILEVLESLGADPLDITLYIAYGTHPKQSEEESLKSYGPAYKNHLVAHHNSKEKSAHSMLGTTKRGTEVRIRKDILRCSLILTFGAISHHYFAGYGGGRKLLFPGLAYQESIYQNHSLFLDFFRERLEPGCQPGKLTGNPLAEDLKEIDDLMPYKISVHGILNSQGEVCELHVGETYDDFLNACAYHDSFYRSQETNKFDVVVASAGGYPKDINYIQSHKSIHNAAGFVKNNGHLILFAECRDGIGNDSFLPIFDAEKVEVIYKNLSKKYSGNGGTALATLAKSKRINIHLVTDLDEAICQKMGMNKIAPQDAQILIDELANKDFASIQNASMLISG